MGERFAIQLTVEEGEKQTIKDVYEEHSINIAGRVLKFIREDVKKLNEEDKEWT